MIDDKEIDLFLEHHGIKGMHWGIRKPEEKKARREAKAKKFDDKAAELQKKIDNTSKWRPVHKAKLRDKRDRAISDAEKKRQGKLSHRQKQVAVGATVAAGIIAAYGTYAALNSGNARRLVSKGKDFITQQHTGWKPNPELADPNLDVDGIMTKVVAHINPGYGAPGTKNNCRRATFAYEMRRRGYDVAATKTHTGRGQDVSGIYNALNPGINLVPVGPTGVMARVFAEGRKKVNDEAKTPFTDFVNKPHALFGDHFFDGEDRASKFLDTIANEPSGARGEMGIGWKGGGGHSVSWEKVHDKLVVFDNQSGKKYEGNDFFELVDHTTQIGYTRLDDKELNQDFLRRWLKSA